MPLPIVTPSNRAQPDRAQPDRAQSLAGFYNPIGMDATFVLPVFRSRTGLTRQIIGSDDRIAGFAPFEDDEDGLIESTEERTARIGDPSLHAFWSRDRGPLIGTRMSLAGSLGARLGEFDDRPHLAAEVQGFIARAKSGSGCRVRVGAQEIGHDPGVPPPFDRDSLRMVAEIVESYLGRNPVSAERLPELIAGVSATLRDLRGDLATSEAAPERDRPKPAVPVRQSVHPDYLICLEDGKKLKTLKQHLRMVYGMTPDEYRSKWGLPADYPMVAPSHAAQRSDSAERIGSGRPAGHTARVRRDAG